MSKNDQALLEDEGAGYLVSVSDIMAGLLFVFIITLVAFVIQFQEASDQKEEERDILKEKVEELTNSRSIRRGLLVDIEQELKNRGIDVEIDPELGVLRLTEKTVQFRKNKAELDEITKGNLTEISSVLASILPCYANQYGAIGLNCDSKTVAKIEAVFIEGHTDNVPVKGIADYNWNLSAARAIATYQYMVESNSVLEALQNGSGQALLSVSGYAERRPLVAHESPTDDARNRRIDIRFIMTPPKETPEIIQAIHEQGIR